MSESVNTLTKILTALVSPKVYLKYIFVALALIVFWKYFTKIGLFSIVGPEHKSIVLLLLSCGSGSLVADIIYYLFSAIQKKYLQKINQKKEKRDKDLEIETFTKTFNLAYNHFSDDQVNFLERLLDDTGTINLNSPDHKILLENQYLIHLQIISQNEVVVALNPLIKDHVIRKRNQLTEWMVEDFINSGSGNAEKLLAFLESPSKTKKHKIHHSYLNEVIKTPICIEAEYSKKENGYHIWFSDRRFEEYFKNKNNKEYTFEAFVKDEYLIV